MVVTKRQPDGRAGSKKSLPTAQHGPPPRPPSPQPAQPPPNPSLVPSQKVPHKDRKLLPNPHAQPTENPVPISVTTENRLQSGPAQEEQRLYGPEDSPADKGESVKTDVRKSRQKRECWLGGQDIIRAGRSGAEVPREAPGEPAAEGYQCRSAESAACANHGTEVLLSKPYPTPGLPSAIPSAVPAPVPAETAVQMGPVSKHSHDQNPWAAHRIAKSYQLHLAVQKTTRFSSAASALGDQAESSVGNKDSELNKQVLA